MRASRFLALAPLVLIFAGSLLGGLIHPLADQYPRGFLTSPTYSNWVHGWTFQVTDNINVTQLGAATPMGTNETFTMVQWNPANETQLATSGFTVNGGALWQWHDLASPVALASGSTYLVSIFAASGHYFPLPGIRVSGFGRSRAGHLGVGRSGPRVAGAQALRLADFEHAEHQT